ncbi:MAG: hypothetical protein GEU28_14055 [Dehalococcoidia bacterium]|nr:hypothetical protein [Dehalococcoidia bacterium]
MAGLPLTTLPELPLFAFPPVEANDEAAVRALWVEMTLRMEAGLESPWPDVTCVGFHERGGATPHYSLGIPAAGALPDGMVETSVPGGRFAQYSVGGSYAGVPAAFQMLSRLCAQGGQVESGLRLEIYRPVDGEGKRVTDVYLGVAE